MPTDDSPLRDVTGEKCGVNQSGDVWFLAGAYAGGKVHRACRVPHGKALFFPIINQIFYARPDVPLRCADAVADAAVNNEHLAYADATLDGMSLPHVEAHRERPADCFHLFAGKPAEAYGSTGFPAATDGYWLMLHPLPPGEHTLAFRAQYNRRGERFGRMAQDIEYHLTVEAP